MLQTQAVYKRTGTDLLVGGGLLPQSLNQIISNTVRLLNHYKLFFIYVYSIHNSLHNFLLQTKAQIKYKKIDHNRKK